MNMLTSGSTVLSHAKREVRYPPNVSYGPSARMGSKVDHPGAMDPLKTDRLVT